MRRPSVEPPPPLRPLGVKLELTLRCNLVCSYCYTNSPQLTRQGPHELSDDEWRKVIDEAIELGVIEAVLTGGEPFLRRDLAIELAESLSAAGVAVVFVTNGWFVDDALVAKLANLPGVQVNVSLDAFGPSEHDAIRGNGSWVRAVEAIDRLVTHGIRHRVLRVVSPGNDGDVTEFLDMLWLLGVRNVRLTEVGPSGAASGRDWTVHRSRAERAIREFTALHPSMAVAYLRSNGGSVSFADDAAVPESVLVRATGEVRPSSTSPVAFGVVPADSLAACWERLRGDWPPKPLVEWAGAAHRGDEVVVPNRDPSFTADTGVPIPVQVRRRDARMPDRPTPAGPAVDPIEVVTSLVRGRRYQTVPFRIAEDRSGRRYARALEPNLLVRVNDASHLLLAAVAAGRVGSVHVDFAVTFPDLTAVRVSRDIAAGLNDLADAGLVVRRANP